MALEKKKMSEIPSDAVILTEEEAIKYHTKLLNNWKVPSDVFAFKYGTLFLGNAALLSGFYFNNYYRKVFKLKHYGRVSSYLPACAIPAALAFMLHEQMVLKDIVLLKQGGCPICLEMRASSIQAITACFIPSVIAPLFSLSLAHRFYTYNLPYITKEPLKLLKLVGEKSKPIKNIAFLIFVAQALLGGVVTYFEADSVYNINLKLINLAETLRQSET